MRKTDIEAWAWRVIDAVSKGHQPEDFTVELKANWIDPTKAARQLAGHANAARGEPILWLVGVSEESGVLGCDPVELANWYPQVQAAFDGPSPELREVRMEDNDLQFVAMYFETDQLPYVVKNRQFGSESGGPVEWEVPWREGAHTLTARRSHLIRLLQPVRRRPEMEFYGARFTAGGGPSHTPLATALRLDVAVFVVPADERPLVFPFHHAIARLSVGSQQIELADPSLGPPRSPRADERYRDATVSATMTEAVVKGPGMLMARFLDLEQHTFDSLEPVLHLSLELGVPGLLQRLVVAEDLHVDAKSSRRWIAGRSFL